MYKKRKNKTKRLEKEAAELISKSRNLKITKLSNVSYDETLRFYYSDEWKRCRKDFLTGKELKCVACNIDLNLYPEMLNVDHILPLKYYWDKRLEKDNLQILCCECNREKGSQILEDIKKIGRKVKHNRACFGLNRQSNLT